jgi:hypothetical protein
VRLTHVRLLVTDYPASFRRAAHFRDREGNLNELYTSMQAEAPR